MAATVSPTFSLLRQLVLRDLRVRYRSTIFGFLWSLVKPAILIALFFAVFQMFPGIRGTLTDFKGSVSFGVFLSIGIITWTFFAGALNEGVNAYLVHHHLITKAAFYRPVLPIASAISHFIHYLVAQAALILFLGFIGYHSWQPQILLLIPLSLVELIMVSSIVAILAWAQVLVRDTTQFLELGLMVWFYGSPIIYPANLPLGFFDSRILDFIYMANPVAPIVLFRQRILMANYLRSPEQLDPTMSGLQDYLLLALLVTAILTAFAWGMNRRVNHIIADRI
ncbi:MAG: ABC transporter permease [Candidatus Omnitrophica bacterium]|nr:ABC transporter permease [Candidatus Omnitrophota bacterium]MCA9441401.1 ABC transporter permease [Candidatus Omnitrophota bacterium]